jgi:uncharacterized membrane protein
LIIEILKIGCYTAPGIFFLAAGIYHRSYMPSFEKGFGYRSTQSILSKKTWKLAQRSIANWSIRFSLIVLAISFLLYCFTDLTLVEEMIFGLVTAILIPLSSKLLTDNMLKDLVKKGMIHD